MKTKQVEDRLRIYWLIVVGIFVLILVRLFMLQVVEASAYRTQSEENRVRIIPIQAPRGEILDRNGVVLAKNKQVFSVTLDQSGGTIPEAVINRLAEILGSTYPEITPASIQEQIKQHQGRRYEPILIKRDIDMTMITRLEEARRDLPGVNIEVEPIRDYPFSTENGDPIAGHLLGFVREINADELNQRNQQAEEGGYYKPGDLIGKDGLEKVYEEYLRGLDGARQVEVNTYNRPISELTTVAATPGNSLILTLDAKLQQTLEKSLDETLLALQQQGKEKAKAGAAVVIDVKTGAILAMASRPNLNPNDFVGSMSQDMVDFYYRSQPAAAINRAIAGVYPPGSTFKPITALAALESQAVKPQQRLISCAGYYPVKPFIGCTGAHGPVNLYTGMAKSCNTYFQEAGRLAGPERMVMVGQQFGLGRRTGIDLPGESQGLLPNPQWKRDLNAAILEKRYQKRFEELEQKYADLLAQAPDEKTYNDLLKKKERERKQLEALYDIDYRFATSWQPYDTFNMSIGQGNNNYTPLQLANYVATLANGGQHFQPYLVDHIVSPQGKTVRQFGPTLLNQVAISPENLEAVKTAMVAVTQPGGTAWSLFRDFPDTIRVAAKTGTAQTGRLGDDKNKDFHGVFVAFAPADNPQIAFAGIVEYGGHGSTSSGYVCRAVFQEYFGLNQQPETGAPVNREVTLPEGGSSVGIDSPGTESNNQSVNDVNNESPNESENDQSNQSEDESEIKNEAENEPEKPLPGSIDDEIGESSSNSADQADAKPPSSGLETGT
ncbi:MAG: penicillin-binding protein 2, partial [Syntrophomonadaceae bacterium]|nr:penicillin-binding protein 2 [Syntrophomonadaceae bacterium]